MRNLLLSSATLLLVPAVSVAAPDFPSHTHTYTPIELEPISDIPASLKLASVCFLGAGDCGDAGFGKGDENYTVDTGIQCINEGYGKQNCNSVQTIDGVCPYNPAYGLGCKCVETLVSCPTPQIGSGESCDGKYISCKCPAGVVEGQYGCEEYYVSPCETVCKKAYTDNCHNRSSVSTPYGCAEYWPDCSGKCKTAYNDNCRNRIEVSHPYGCESYYADCQAKCEVAKSEPKCQIGSVYYSDGSCALPENHDTSKTVLGIVVHITDGGQHGQIMAPWLVDEDGNILKTTTNSAIAWDNLNINIPIPDLPEIRRIDEAMKDYDSCGNTEKIVRAGDASTYPAAWAARRYTPTEATKGKWCLPAAGILAKIYDNLTVIQNTTDVLGIFSQNDYNLTYLSDYGWSSTKGSGGAWVAQSRWLIPPEKIYGINSGNLNGAFVWPVLEF